MPELKKNNSIKAIIEGKVSGKNVAVMDFTKRNPTLAALISKLVSANWQTPVDTYGNRRIEGIDQATMRDASEYIMQKSKDADTVMELFPEMELAAQILISSVLSPKDMMSTELNYTLPPDLKVSPLATTLLPIIQDHFEKSYKIEPLLPKILYECLFGSGSYPLAVIPENSVDDLINGKGSISSESLSLLASSDGTFRSIGILGSPSGNKPKTFSLEDINLTPKAPLHEDERFIKTVYGNRVYTLEGITVTDNFNGLKLPKIIDKARKDAVSHALSPLMGSLETYRGFSSTSTGAFTTPKLSDVQLQQLFYKNRAKPYDSIVKVKSDSELKRSMIGAPLTLKAPSSAVIPVYTPGDAEKHIGYFFLLDSECNFLSSTSVDIDETALAGRLQTSDMASYLLKRTKDSMQSRCTAATFRQASRVFADIIESDLLARLRNGIIGSAVTISKNEEVYRIMLARSLMKQGTQILYVPIEMVTYFAIKYNDYGVGESLLDKMRTLNSLRAMLLFAKTMAQVRNSIGRSKVTVKLDPDDPNPQKTLETTIHEWARTRQAGFPVNILNVGDITEWVQKAGVEFAYEGHPGMPDMAIDFAEHNTNYSEPNQDLSDSLEKKAIMATWLPPETVDNSVQPEFATTAVANNILLSKRVTKIQEVFVPQVTDHCRKVAMYNSFVVDQIKTAIKENLKKITATKDTDPIIAEYESTNKDLLVHILAMEFLSNFEVSLAQPDTVVLKNQQEAMDTYEQMLDKAIAYYISTDILPPSMVGEQANERIDEIRQIAKGHFMRLWLNDNHVLSELSQLGQVDDEGNPVLDLGKVLKDHIHAMTKSTVTLMGVTVPVGQAADRDIEKITGGEDLGESTASSYDSSSSDSEDESSSSSDFGGDADMFDFGSPTGDEGESEGETEDEYEQGQEPEQSGSNDSNT